MWLSGRSLGEGSLWLCRDAVGVCYSPFVDSQTCLFHTTKYILIIEKTFSILYSWPKNFAIEQFCGIPKRDLRVMKIEENATHYGAKEQKPDSQMQRRVKTKMNLGVIVIKRTSYNGFRSVALNPDAVKCGIQNRPMINDNKSYVTMPWVLRHNALSFTSQCLVLPVVCCFVSWRLRLLPG